MGKALVFGIAAILFMLVLASGGSFFHDMHDERAEQAAIEQAWPDWLKQPGGGHGR